MIGEVDFAAKSQDVDINAHRACRGTVLQPLIHVRLAGKAGLIHTSHRVSGEATKDHKYQVGRCDWKHANQHLHYLRHVLTQSP